MRCLTCRRSGHRACDCEDCLAISNARIAALPCARPTARRPDGSSSWAEVVAPATASRLARTPEKMAELASQLEEKAVSGLRRLESVGLIERTEVSLERLSMAPDVVRTTATPPPLAGFGAGCADGGSELFGCYSPRNATNAC